MWSEECKVWSVVCKVWSVEWKVWSDIRVSIRVRGLHLV